MVERWRAAGRMAPLPPGFLQVRILKGLAAEILVTGEYKEVTEPAFRLKTGKTRCLLVSVHSTGLTGEHDELAEQIQAEQKERKARHYPPVILRQARYLVNIKVDGRIVEASRYRF